MAEINKIVGPQTPAQKATGWPNAEEKTAIWAAISTGKEFFTLANREFRIIPCKVDTDCHIVKPVKGFYPCGHFSQRP